jgi:hypothetical protein
LQGIFFFGFETIESRLEVVEEVDCLRDTNDDSQDESPEIDCFVELLVLWDDDEASEYWSSRSFLSNKLTKKNLLK